MAYNAKIICNVKIPALHSASAVAVELTGLDKLTTVSSLCEQLSDRLASASSGESSFQVVELRWKGSACDPANPLQLYIEHGSGPAEKNPTKARFTALVTVVAKASSCVLHVIDRAGSGSSSDAPAAVLDIGSPHITVDNFRQRVLEAVPRFRFIDGLAMYHQGEKMSDGSKLLSDYYVQAADKPQDIIVSKGGATRAAVGFADISNSAALKKIGWADSAPEWCYVAKGLNIEGRCKNMLCKAYNEIVVDPSHGLHNPCHHFDLRLSEKSCPCPMCKDTIEIDTCGFTDCEWLYSGVKRIEGGIKHKMGDWKVAGDKYELFTGAKAGNRAEWESLMIITRPRRGPKAPPTCCECEEPILGSNKPGGEGKNLSCGHSVHLTCLASASNGAPSCPKCNVASPDPSLAGSVAAAAERLRPEAELIPMLEKLQAAVGPLLNRLKN